MPRVFIRVQTSAGPRTVISQNFSAEHAWEVSNALGASGIETHLSENAIALDLKTLVRRRRKEAAKAIPSPVESNVTKLPMGKGRTDGRR